MRILRLIPIAVLLWLTSAFPQSNKIVFGPLEGDDAGVLTVRNGENIGIELWVRTDPDNPTGIVGIAHGLMSEDAIIAERNGMNLEYPYDSWVQVWVEEPFVHDPDDAYPIPEGWTCEIQGALGCPDWPPYDCDSLDTQGEWDLYGTWLMVTNTGVPTEETYYPFATGWYPNNGQGTIWIFNSPPGGDIVPQQSYCGLYFERKVNRLVYGPLEGDDAGVLTVHDGQDIQIEMWVRTDPENPAPFVGVVHGLMSEDAIIAERNEAEIDPEYDVPNWEQVFVDGPYTHNPNDAFPIPEGHTCQIQVAFYTIFDPPVGDPLNTQGEWDYYGAFLMTCNTDVPNDNTYYPFQMGWYPQSSMATRWYFEMPPGGWSQPEQDYCGLYFEQNPCEYIPGDCDHNGISLELSDVITMIGTYRGTVPVPFICPCPPDDDEFAATADPNGNCIPNELNDVVTEIAAYRGTAGASGCPDCPGSQGLLIGKNQDQ